MLGPDEPSRWRADPLSVEGAARRIRKSLAPPTMTCRSCGHDVPRGPVLCGRCGEHWPALSVRSYVTLYLSMILTVSLVLLYLVRMVAIR